MSSGNEAGPSAAAGGGKVVFKKAGKFANRRQMARKRRSSSDDGDDEVVFRDRKRRNNPLVQSTGAARRKANGGGESSDSDPAVAPHDDVVYESTKTAEPAVSRDKYATATCEVDAAHGADAQAVFERDQHVIKARLDGALGDNVYKGMNAVGKFFEKKDSALGKASSGLNRKGPIRAPNFVRQSIRWDYQPDICKDYKETGFCGFGDSCKFMHDRTDYKFGWELEREWADGRYGHNDADPRAYEVSDSDGDDQLPFKCHLCRQSFTEPVVTKCKHYFCEKCALDNYSKSTKCFVCDKPTGGVFAPAKEVMARMGGEMSRRKRRRLLEKEHSSSSDDGGEAEQPTEVIHERKGDGDTKEADSDDCGHDDDKSDNAASGSDDGANMPDTEMERLPDPDPILQSSGSDSD